MRKIFPFILIIIGVCVLTGVTSCAEDDDCSGNARHMLTANFMTVITTDSATWEVPVKLDTLTVYANRTDSIIINDMTEVESISLPLRTNLEETTMVFSYTFHEGDSLPQFYDKDTITFRHHNTPYFLTMDCNFAVKQVLTDISYTTNMLDSIVIVNPTASIDGTENIKIYY